MKKPNNTTNYNKKGLIMTDIISELNIITPDDFGQKLKAYVLAVDSELKRLNNKINKLIEVAELLHRAEPYEKFELLYELKHLKED